MSVKDRSKIIDRIRAAMAIADNPSSSQEERDQATRTVAKLITQYQIEMAELRVVEKTGPAPIVHFTVELSNRYGLGGIRARALARAVSTPMGGTEVYWHSPKSSAKLSTRMVVFLSQDVADTAKALMASLALQVETSMGLATDVHRQELRMGCYDISEMQSELRRFRQSYLIGWGRTVGNRVAEGREEARVEASELTGKEVVLVNDSTRTKAAVHDMFGSVRKARAVHVSSTGASAGIRDGKRADIGLRSLDR